MSSIQALRVRYTNALHAVQSGVLALFLHENGPANTYHDKVIGECSRKHLRVGVNSALLDSAAIARLLIAKGVFTEEEHAEALAELAEQEKALYEAKLSGLKGAKVSLG